MGLYALLAVELTSLARAHISKRLWRRVHFASFALFVLTTIHALTAGTDRRSPPFVAAVAATCALVVALTGARAARAHSVHQRMLNLAAPRVERDRPLVGSGVPS